MIQRLTIALAQEKRSNTSENLLNDLCQNIFFLYQVKNLLVRYIVSKKIQ